ncbi:hypothetical protein Tco_1103941 [Tanacetum coccineum]
MRGEMVVVGGCEGEAAAMAVTVEWWCACCGVGCHGDEGVNGDGGRLSGGAIGGVMEMMTMATMLMEAAVMEMVEEVAMMLVSGVATATKVVAVVVGESVAVA